MKKVERRPVKSTGKSRRYDDRVENTDVKGSQRLCTETKIGSDEMRKREGRKGRRGKNCHEELRT